MEARRVRRTRTPSSVGSLFEKLGGALIALGGLVLTLQATLDPQNTVGMNFWFVLGVVLIGLGALAFLYGITTDFVRTRSARPDEITHNSTFAERAVRPSEPIRRTRPASC